MTTATRPKLTERQQVMVSLLKRISFRKKNLTKTRRFHAEIERELAGKIRRDEMQLDAFKRTK